MTSDTAVGTSAAQASVPPQLPPEPRRAPGTRKSRLRRVVHSWQLYVLLAPAVVYLVVFKYWPMYGAQIAFRDYNPVDGFFWSPWVGLEHFSDRSEERRVGRECQGGWT